MKVEQDRRRQTIQIYSRAPTVSLVDSCWVSSCIHEHTGAIQAQNRRFFGHSIPGLWHSDCLIGLYLKYMTSRHTACKRANPLNPGSSPGALQQAHSLLTGEPSLCKDCSRARLHQGKFNSLMKNLPGVDQISRQQISLYHTPVMGLWSFLNKVRQKVPKHHILEEVL